MALRLAARARLGRGRAVREIPHRTRLGMKKAVANATAFSFGETAQDLFARFFATDWRATPKCWVDTSESKMRTLSGVQSMDSTQASVTFLIRVSFCSSLR